jgi:hypothetical protein
MKELRVVPRNWSTMTVVRTIGCVSSKRRRISKDSREEVTDTSTNTGV